MTIDPGTIVTPQGDPDERIIGIVLSTDPIGLYAQVAWLSASRGAFLCEEVVADMDIAPLNEREGINDDPIDHEALAAAILDLAPDEADDDDEEDDTRYDIVRYRFQGDAEIIREDVSLAEAQEHCNDESTHGDGWFDGYRRR